MLVILVIALLVFGPGKLPEIGKSLGKGIAEFKKASRELARTWEESASESKQDPPPAANAGNPTDNSIHFDGTP